MKISNKIIGITVLLLLGWAALIWVQWQQPVDIAKGLVGIPVAMILMAALAAIAANDGGSDV